MVRSAGPNTQDSKQDLNFNQHAYQPRVNKDYNPNGEGYDHKSAVAGGLRPGEDGHWPSLRPLTEREARTKNLPVGASLVLKGRGNSGEWDPMLKRENRLNRKIIQHNDGRYYSVPRPDLNPIDAVLGAINQGDLMGDRTQLPSFVEATPPPGGPIIDMDIVRHLESSGRPDAVSDKGAIGLYQVMEGGALADWNKDHPDQQYRKNDLYDPDINSKIAHWYMLEKIPSYFKSWDIPLHQDYILGAYNWGPGNLRNWYKAGADINQMIEDTDGKTLRYIEDYQDMFNAQGYSDPQTIKLEKELKRKMG